MHANARQQLARNDRLGHIVDAAGLETLDDVLAVAQPGHEDDRHMCERAVLLEPAAGLETIGARHDRVHQDHIRRDLVDNGESVLALTRHQDRHAGLFDGVRQHAQRVGGVIYHEHEISALPTHGCCERPPMRRGSA